jgi:exosortase/archaeosortase family protein
MHLNYVQGLRRLLLLCSAQIINWLGYNAITNNYQMLVAGHGIIQIVYSCLGLGLMSFFAAFVLSYPAGWKSRLIFLFCGLVMIQLLNIVRFILLALFWDKKTALIADHHTIFNLIIYILIAVSLFLWVKENDRKQSTLTKN